MNAFHYAWRCCFVLTLVSAGLPASAQTCASPIAITDTGTVTGNTCNNTNQLPYLANGAISVIGNQDVYYIDALNAHSITLTVQPEATVDLGLYICRNQCSTYASCTAAVDPGVAGTAVSAPLPDGPGDYYVIVAASGSLGPMCGNYTLTLTAPLDD
jgi:hypothetical protein